MGLTVLCSGATEEWADGVSLAPEPHADAARGSATAGSKTSDCVSLYVPANAMVMEVFSRMIRDVGWHACSINIMSVIIMTAWASYCMASGSINWCH